MPVGYKVTDAMRRIVLDIIAEGGSNPQAAKAIGVSVKTVERIRRKAGISAGCAFARFSPEEDKLARAMLEDGASFNEVARTLNRALSTICRKYKGMGWTKQELSEFNSWQMRMRHARKGLRMTEIV